MYYGGFKTHKREGEGSMLDDNCNDLYVGQWKNDKPVNNKAVLPLVMKIPQIWIDINSQA